MPIKRHEVLKPLSREHHQGLLLCWKIRTGLKKQVELERINKYVNWFWIKHLKPHFKIEELHIFPILGNKHELIKKALAEHSRLRHLFETSDKNLKTLSLIEEELENHIRYEERVLFNEIQTKASDEQLLHLKVNHKEMKFCDNLIDSFWD